MKGWELPRSPRLLLALVWDATTARWDGKPKGGERKEPLGVCSAAARREGGEMMVTLGAAGVPPSGSPRRRVGAGWRGGAERGRWSGGAQEAAVAEMLHSHFLVPGVALAFSSA